MRLSINFTHAGTFVLISFLKYSILLQMLCIYIFAQFAFWNIYFQQIYFILIKYENI